MRRLVLVALAASLSGCGSTGPLRPAAGRALPVAPYGATATPTPDKLLTPSIQSRPGRRYELLLNSQPRSADDFDLPPE